MSGLELVSSIFILLGAIFVFNAVVGVIRFPNTLATMHANSKPQTLGLLFIIIGLLIYLHSWTATGMLLLCFVFTLLTVPAVNYTLARVYYLQQVAKLKSEENK